jgi:hypothetical protein
LKIQIIRDIILVGSQALIFSNVLNLSTRINRAPICSQNLKTEDKSIYRALHDEGVLLHVFVPCTKDRNSPMAVGVQGLNFSERSSLKT